MKISLLQDSVITNEWAGILGYTCEVQISGELPCEMMFIPQPSAIKPAEDEVNDIHSQWPSRQKAWRKYRYFLIAGSIS